MRTPNTAGARRSLPVASVATYVSSCGALDLFSYWSRRKVAYGGILSRFMTARHQAAYLRTGSLTSLRHVCWFAAFNPTALPPGSAFLYLHGLAPYHKRYYTGYTAAVRENGQPGPVCRYTEHFDNVVYEGTRLRA